MLEGFGNEQYEIHQNGGPPKPLYTEYSEKELGAAYEDAYIFFDPGDIQLYAGAQQILEIEEVAWRDLVMRHIQGDFGDMTKAEEELNHAAITAKHGLVLSRYNFEMGHVDITTDLDWKITKIT